MQIIPNVHVIPGAIVNLYLIIDADGLTLIDAGLVRSGKKILRYIASLGHTPHDLRRIVITHSDGDHVGGLAALKAASGARVYASPIEAKAIAAGSVSRELKLRGLVKWLYETVPWFKVEPATVDETLTDGQVLPVLGGLRVVETPGHTPGHISLFAPSARILFVGDSLISRWDQLHPSRGINTWDEALAMKSAKAQAALGARIVCPAHGPVVKNAVGKFVEEIRDGS
jgi:glyoxylase-like metal-dependent hydrolase (beta-lactamase superfamily II)